ncbi:MAG: hypothetical protein JW993_02520 [Sedimentisphaerales bacterium]|nr:hypothetical protein [Sedimentisphaerales bacterium]
MNTIWLKLAAVAVGIVVVIVVVSKFTSSNETPAPPAQTQEEEKPRTIYDQFERDKQFLERAQPANEPVVTPEPATEPQTVQEVPHQEPTQQVAQPQSQYVLPSSITQTTTLYFKPLDEIDDIAAQQLMPWATTGRSLGRLPFLQYGTMVKPCKEVLQRWPDSEYAFRAKQLLEEIFERYGDQYQITEQDLDISRFLKSRQGTVPMDVEPVQR